MKQLKLYLHGEWVDLADHFVTRDPGTGEALAEVPSAGRAEARRAIQDAIAAFQGWRSLTAMARGDHLLAVAGELHRRKEEIAAIITRENGKPLAQSRGEVDVAADHFRWFAEEARRAYGRVIPQQADGKRHLVIRTPIGVVAAISPWNFPLVLAARKTAPALAAGCPVILRPASQTPMSAVALAECIATAGLPPGVFQVIAGPAQPIADEFLANPGCSKITFTGSTAVGRKLLAASAQNITKLSLELGGHAPVLVFADADLDAAVDAAMITKFRNNGQSCIAANRIFVERAAYKSFVDRFVDRVRELKVGYGLGEGVDVGPLINKDGFELALRHIQDARESGGQVLCGGKQADIDGGYYLQPTVIADVSPNALCMREETFAPVAPVSVFDSEQEAIAKANDTRYGLAAYAFTTDINRAWRIAELVDAGTIAINDAVPSTSNAPFGGVKESGVGRELGMAGLDAFLETKHISFGGVNTV